MLKILFALFKKDSYNKVAKEVCGDMEKKDGILKVVDLACYIKSSYKNKYSKDISGIKLQKALYFCFAYWGGFVEKSKMSSEEEISYSPKLFDAKFQAWVYGPVVPLIFAKEKLKELNCKITEEELFKGNEILKETINSVMYDLFEISDFKLVSLSHEDDSWKKNFNIEEEEHKEEMSHEEIIREYTIKAFN